MLKKVLLILAFIMTFSMFVFTASAAPKIGEPIGDILYSDIIAYINGDAIPTSAMTNKTLIVVEDLAKYGFDVVWNKNEKSLKVERNENKKVTPLKVEKDTTHKSGMFKCNYLYTDIKTYLSGIEVESYNINGRTFIDFELLKKYGKVVWDGKARTISLIMVPIEKPKMPEAIAIELTTETLTEKIVEKTTEIPIEKSTEELKEDVNLIKYYDECPDIPDFGALTGAILLSEIPTKNLMDFEEIPFIWQIQYKYEGYTQENLNNFIRLLQENGYNLENKNIIDEVPDIPNSTFPYYFWNKDMLNQLLEYINSSNINIPFKKLEYPIVTTTYKKNDIYVIIEENKNITSFRDNYLLTIIIEKKQ